MIIKYNIEQAITPILNNIDNLSPTISIKLCCNNETYPLYSDKNPNVNNMTITKNICLYPRSLCKIYSQQLGGSSVVSVFCDCSVIYY